MKASLGSLSTSVALLKTALVALELHGSPALGGDAAHTGADCLRVRLPWRARGAHPCRHALAGCHASFCECLLACNPPAAPLLTRAAPCIPNTKPTVAGAGARGVAP